jgi:para-nitrobenzyl esterase
MSTIDTRLGRITGIDHGSSLAFRGIRYGLPPTGDLRFMPPVAAGRWNGTVDATRYPNRAMQGRKLGTMGQETPGELDEDCLFLNVDTPSTTGLARPVMLWIHGGGFNAGGANEYDGRVLASQGDVVVVTINYRLGPFGFLNLEPLGEAFRGSASNGYRDMILALQWVRDNVADYGGDAGNVTIFGESAGAIAVLALLASPSADGLYHKAISHSPGAPRAPDGDKTVLMAEKLSVDKSQLLTTLRGMTAEELLAAGLPAGCELDGTVVTRGFNEAILDRGEAGVPLIVGTNRTEGTLFTPPDTDDEDLSGYEKALYRAAGGVMQGEDTTGYVDGLKAAYPDLNAKRLMEMISTDNFRRPSVEAAECATAAGPGGWLYRFDLATTLEYNGKLTDATHACEMAFTYNAYADPDCHVFAIHDPKQPGVLQLSEQWSATLTRFAWTGDPNGGGLPPWPPYKEDERSVMLLDATSHVAQDPDEINRKLWQGEA